MEHEIAEGAGSGIALVVMCMVPLTGRGEARLSPPLSGEEAGALSGCFVADLAATLSGLETELPVRRVAAFAPSVPEESVRALLPESFTTLAQRGDSFGQRIGNVVEDLLAAGHDGVCLINAACPTLPAFLLQQAIERVARPDEGVVLGPALGGGYSILGVRRPAPASLAGISWGSGPLKQTLARAEALSLAVETLSPWYSVGDGLALNWLLREVLGDGVSPLGNGLVGAAAPRTRAYLTFLTSRGDGPPADPGPNAKDPRGR